MLSPSKQQFSILLLIVFVGFIGISVAYPLFSPLFLSPEYSKNLLTPAEEPYRFILLGIALATYPLGQFFGSPILGAFSDKYGRRQILIISLAGTLLGYLFTAIALQWGWLWCLIASRFFTGVMEGNFAIAQSIIADMKDINKHKGFGSVIMAAATGYVIGPLIGGFFSDQHLVPWFNMALPFYIAALFSFITLYLVYSKLPETHLQRETQTRLVWKQMNVFRHLHEIMQMRALKFLLLAGLAFTLGVDLFYEFNPVLLTGRFLMGPAQIAIYNALLSITIAMGGMWLSHRSVLHFSNRTVVISVTSIFAIFLIMMVLTHSPWFLLFLFSLIGFAIPIPSNVVNVEISDIAGPEIQGKVMGMLWGLRMLGDAIICLCGGLLIIYSVSVPLILGASAAFLSIMLYLCRSKPQ